MRKENTFGHEYQMRIIGAIQEAHRLFRWKDKLHTLLEDDWQFLSNFKMHKLLDQDFCFQELTLPIHFHLCLMMYVQGELLQCCFSGESWKQPKCLPIEHWVNTRQHNCEKQCTMQLLKRMRQRTQFMTAVELCVKGNSVCEI